MAPAQRGKKEKIVVDRVIVFSLDAVKRPEIFEAMVGDNVQTFATINSATHGQFARVQDSISDNFPKLRAALSAANVSYDFYQRRANDGDHAGWWKSRNGAAEEYENLGLSDKPITPLYE